MIEKSKKSDTLRIKTQIQFLKYTKTSREFKAQLCMVNVKNYPDRTGALKENKPKLSAISLYEKKKTLNETCLKHDF